MEIDVNNALPRAAPASSGVDAQFICDFLDAVERDGLELPLERTVSGTRWSMEPNEDAIEWIKLDFTAEGCRFSLQDDRGVHRIDAGRGVAVDGWTSMTGNKLHHEYQSDKARVIAQGAWPSPQRFVMTWRFPGTAFCDTAQCSFDGDRLRFERSVNTNSGELERPTISGCRSDPA